MEILDQCLTKDQREAGFSLEITDKGIFLIRSNSILRIFPGDPSIEEIHKEINFWLLSEKAGITFGRN